MSIEKLVARLSLATAIGATACSDYDVGSGADGANRGAVALTGEDDGGGLTTPTGDPDEDPGEGDDGDDEADLPYDARLDIGDTFVLTDAFDEKGDLPAAILSVTMDDGTWRLAELASLTPFTVDQADCDHAGNRDEGRDRIEVEWQNADGSEDEDHLDLRYCD